MAAGNCMETKLAKASVAMVLTMFSGFGTGRVIATCELISHVISWYCYDHMGNMWHKSDVKRRNTLDRLDHYAAHTAPLEVSATALLKCRRVPPSLKMCYQTLTIHTQHQIVNNWNYVAPAPQNGCECQLEWWVIVRTHSWLTHNTLSWRQIACLGTKYGKTHHIVPFHQYLSHQLAPPVALGLLLGCDKINFLAQSSTSIVENKLHSQCGILIFPTTSLIHCSKWVVGWNE